MRSKFFKCRKVKPWRGTITRDGRQFIGYNVGGSSADWYYRLNGRIYEIQTMGDMRNRCCWRFGRHGWKTLCVPAVAVTHLGGRSSGLVPRETRWRLCRSACRFYRKAYGRFGAVLPSAVALGRFLLSPLRRNAT